MSSMASAGEVTTNHGPETESEQPVLKSTNATSATYDAREEQLAELRLANEELKRRLASTEKDRDLFRDLYSKASAHASDVSNENNELSERAALAEGQARDGVAMARATHEGRVRTLEQEVEHWKGQCHILAERERRTDSDAIRQRAALEPELRFHNTLLVGRVQDLEEQLYMLEKDYKRLEGVVEAMTRQHVEETSALESTVSDGVALPTSDVEAV